MSVTCAGKRKRRKAVTDQLTQHKEDELCYWYWDKYFFYDKINRAY